MNFKDKLKEIGLVDNLGPDADNFLDILETPDDWLDAIYPDFRKNMIEGLRSPEVQKNIKLRSPQSFSTPEEEQKALDDMCFAIDSIEDLSENKKDMIKTYIVETTKLTRELIDNPRERIPVKIKLLNENAKVPTYARPSDAGSDVYSAETITIAPGQTYLVSTGIAVAIPAGYMIQLYPRSGLSVKTGLRLANSVGIIDSEYRGEVKVAFTNIGSEPETVNQGDRIAQMIIAETPMINWEVVDELDKTTRGDGGFGSTGKS